MTGHDGPEFRVLGPLEVLDSGRSIGLGGLRQRTLLVLLLLRANEAVSRDRLIDDLWGAEPPATAANSLAALVARLRRAATGGSAADDAGRVRADDRARSAGPSSIRAARGGRWERAGSSGAEPGSRAPPLRAVAMAGPGPRGLRIRGVCSACDRPARGATARCAREQDRRRSRSRSAPRPRGRAAGTAPRAPAARALARPADARALPIRPAGRGARGIPGRPTGVRRGARHRARPRVAGARRGDPPPGPAARRAGNARRLGSRQRVRFSSPPRAPRRSTHCSS